MTFSKVAKTSVCNCFLQNEWELSLEWVHIGNIVRNIVYWSLILREWESVREEIWVSMTHLQNCKKFCKD